MNQTNWHPSKSKLDNTNLKFSHNDIYDQLSFKPTTKEELHSMSADNSAWQQEVFRVGRLKQPEINRDGLEVLFDGCVGRAMSDILKKT